MTLLSLSCPCLSRASTPCDRKKAVDARDEREHDAEAVGQDNPSKTAFARRSEPVSNPSLNHP